MPVSRRREHLPLQIFADVQEPEATLAHQPLVGAGRREVDAQRFDVDGDGADRLDDIGEDERAARMRQRADRLAVVHVAVDVGDQRERHQPGVAIDRPIDVLDVDGPVAMLDDAELEAFLLELLVHVERGREVQFVENDVAAAAAGGRGP